MSKYIIDKKGEVSYPTGAVGTFHIVTSKDVDRMIGNGKFSKAEVKKIKTNRAKHAQQDLTKNVPESNDETPLEMPPVMGDTKPADAPKPSNSKGEQTSKQSKSFTNKMPAMKF